MLGSVTMGFGQMVMGICVQFPLFADPFVYYGGAVLAGIGNGMLVITALQHILAWSVFILVHCNY